MCQTIDILFTKDYLFASTYIRFYTYISWIHDDRYPALEDKMTLSANFNNYQNIKKIKSRI